MTDNSHLINDYTEVLNVIQGEFYDRWMAEKCKWFFKLTRQKAIINEVATPHTTKILELLDISIKNKFPYTYDLMSPDEKIRIMLRDPVMSTLATLIFPVKAKDIYIIREFNEFVRNGGEYRE